MSLLVSYRADDLYRRHPMRRILADWGRLPGLVHAAVEPLEERAVREFVGRLHPGALPEPEARGIVDRSEGNAFFVEDLVAALGVVGMPFDLADLLLVALDPLDDAARRVVRAAAAVA